MKRNVVEANYADDRRVLLLSDAAGLGASARAFHTACRRARAGRRPAAGVGAGLARPAVLRGLRPRPVLRRPMRLLRLQHLHRGGAREQLGASRATYAEAVLAEVALARRVLGPRDLPVSSVFFGGGTPTLLKPVDLSVVVSALAADFGLADGAEITTEANPDSVTQWDLDDLRAAGFTRISFGMQSAVPSVLATLDRTHDPLRVPAAVAWARAAGFEQVSPDLIYGTPGESLADWARSLEEALACEPNHVSAYSLIVEEGTALARRVRRGELPPPDEDDLADKYLLADERLTAAGFEWYELSNWARTPEARCRHNLLY
ncbi:MAG: coproporphyrinogen-III oxidase family protein [Nocardioides sp.]